MVESIGKLLFATPLTIFKCEPEDLSKLDRINMISYIQQNSNKNKSPRQTASDLYKLSTFRKLYDVIMKQCEIHIKGLEYEYDKLDMVSMWGNYLTPGKYHPEHTHPNSFITGVFYLLSSGRTHIEFSDPRAQAGVLVPRKTKETELNSTIIACPCTEGSGYIFPSWLQHTVKTTPKDRISISWNIILRGEYGQPNSLQNAHI